MFCPKCGVQQIGNANWCSSCGFDLRQVSSPQMRAPSASQPLQPFQQPQPFQPQQHMAPGKSRVAFILLALFLGTLGIHNFYAGYAGRGVAQLLITLLTGWLVVPLVCIWIWNLIEMIAVEQDAQGIRFT